MKKVKELKIIPINNLRMLFTLKYLYIILYDFITYDIKTDKKGKIKYDNKLEYKIGNSIIRFIK